jgi:3-keto-5-aminohexanoate cleavage enzyme
MRDVMIMVAPNGAWRGKADHPALPMTVAEIARDAAACAEAHAAAIHLHIRDAGGRHTLDTSLYREATAAIRTAAGSDLIVQITTEAIGQFSPSEQMACVRAVRPEAASLALREILPEGAQEQEVATFFRWMAAEEIAPQFILYVPTEVERLFDLVSRGVLPFSRPSMLFVLGRYSVDEHADPADLDAFVTALGGLDASWTMCAFGAREAECALRSARLGGHVRVGFENNLSLPDGTTAASNANLVAATAGVLRAAGFGTLEPPAARATMGIKAG